MWIIPHLSLIPQLGMYLFHYSASSCAGSRALPTCRLRTHHAGSEVCRWACAVCPRDPLNYPAGGSAACPSALHCCCWPENIMRSNTLWAMPKLGREGKAPVEMQGLTWSISRGWELPSLAGMGAMLVSMETQRKMCFHIGTIS